MSFLSIYFHSTNVERGNWRSLGDLDNNNWIRIGIKQQSLLQSYPNVFSSSGSGYHGLPSAATSPYAAAAAAAASYSPLATAGFPGTYTHQHSGSLGMSGTSHLHNGISGYDTTTAAIQPSTASTSPLGGLYGMSTASQCRNSMMAFSGMSGLSTMGQWPTTPILSSNHGSFSSFQSRPTSNSTGPLHSPLTAQVYSADTTGTNQLRTHSAQSIDVGDSTYALQQQSPEPLLPECASTEPVNASE